MKLKVAKRFLYRNSMKNSEAQSPSWRRRMVIAGRVVKEAEVKK